MTFIGKTLVMVNLFLSLLMATIAFGVFANGLDWTDKKAPKAGKPDGLIKQKQEAIDKVGKGAPLAVGSWTRAEEDLLTQEDIRRQNQAFYQKELKHPRSEATDADAVRAVNRKDFLPVLDEKNEKNKTLPEMIPYTEPGIAKLLSLDYYVGEVEKKRKEIEDALTEYKKQIDEDVKLTEELGGTKDGTKKGLRRILAEEQTKFKELEEEDRQIKPLFVNVAVDSDLALRRLKSLSERIAELEAYLAKRKVDETLSKR